MEELKLSVDDIQEQDLINIKKQGYSNNLIITNDSDKGYSMNELPAESELPF